MTFDWTWSWAPPAARGAPLSASWPAAAIGSGRSAGRRPRACPRESRSWQPTPLTRPRLARPARAPRSLPLRAAALPAVGDGIPALTQSIADAAAGAGARLVYADDLYTYGLMDGPITEDLPRWRPPARVVRALMAERLLAAHRSGPSRWSSVAPRTTTDPAGQQRRRRHPVRRGHRGQTSPLAGPPGGAASPELPAGRGQGAITLGARPGALGENGTPAAEPVTRRGFVDLIGAALGRAIKVDGDLPPGAAAGGVFDPRARETTEMLYQWGRPFVLDASNSSAPSAPSSPHRTTRPFRHRRLVPAASRPPPG